MNVDFYLFQIQYSRKAILLRWAIPKTVTMQIKNTSFIKNSKQLDNVENTWSNDLSNDCNEWTAAWSDFPRDITALFKLLYLCNNEKRLVLRYFIWKHYNYLRFTDSVIRLIRDVSSDGYTAINFCVSWLNSSMWCLYWCSSAWKDFCSFCWISSTSAVVATTPIRSDRDSMRFNQLSMSILFASYLFLIKDKCESRGNILFNAENIPLRITKHRCKLGFTLKNGLWCVLPLIAHSSSYKKMIYLVSFGNMLAWTTTKWIKH